MNDELDRVRKDVETIQHVMGLTPAMDRGGLRWLRRDQWFSLWWIVPGVIVIVAALLPLDRSQRHWGLVPDQWAGILVAAALLGIAMGHSRRVAGRDGRPESIRREARRSSGANAQGAWFGLALGIQLLLYVAWSQSQHLGFETFWAGLFALTGSTCLVAALTARAWILLGYAVPFLAYGLCLPWVGDHRAARGVLFGMMFIAVALCFSFIQACQLWHRERQDASH